MAQAYFPVRQPNYCGPWYDTPCRDSIEDLKALVEVTQSFKHENNNYSCSTCATTFSEEIIMKLINALIFTATHNCGYNSGSGGHYPGPPWPPSHNGCTKDGCPSGGTSGKNDDGLINVGVLDGKDTLSLGVGGTKVLGVDVGKQSGSSDGESPGKTTTKPGGNGDDGVIQVGVLNKDNSLANVGLGGTTVLNVALGKDKKDDSEADSTYPKKRGTNGPTSNPDSSSPGGNTGTVPVSTSPVSTGTPAIPTSTGHKNGVPVNNGPEEAERGLSNNSDNLGGVTNPTNTGDVNQVNQQVNNIISTS